MKKAKKDFLTKEEFCEAIKTSMDCWIFKNEKEFPMTFWKEKTKDGVIYHSEQGCEHRKFKDVGGEIWMSL